jgi:hypothetical protein
MHCEKRLRFIWKISHKCNLKGYRSLATFGLALIGFMAIFHPLLSVELPVQKRDISKELSVSVIIPCDIAHLPLLFPLLDYFQKQTTVFPSEIIISLSNTNNLHKEEIHTIETHSWPFSVKVISHTGRKTAGANRNIAAQYASGDILICQDADDLPHPQRVEIVKHMFQTYDIDHLFHAFISYYRSFVPYEIEQIRICRFSSIDEMFECYAINNYSITNGNVSFTREVIKNICFPDSNAGEDVQFNRRVYTSYKSATIFAKLLMYRINLSANNPGFSWPPDINF